MPRCNPADRAIPIGFFNFLVIQHTTQKVVQIRIAAVSVIFAADHGSETWKKNSNKRNKQSPGHRTDFFQMFIFKSFDCDW